MDAISTIIDTLSVGRDRKNDGGRKVKAILVLDMPESCTSCLLGIYNKKWFCLKTNKDIDITDRYNIPDWCPLKPMPKRKDILDSRMKTAIGWNECIEEIEKPEIQGDLSTDDG